MNIWGWESNAKTVKRLNNISHEEFNALYETITFYGYAELQSQYETT